jgi:hypothetical protein
VCHVRYAPDRTWHCCRPTCRTQNTVHKAWVRCRCQAQRALSAKTSALLLDTPSGQDNEPLFVPGDCCMPSHFLPHICICQTQEPKAHALPVLRQLPDSPDSACCTQGVYDQVQDRDKCVCCPGLLQSHHLKQAKGSSQYGQHGGDKNARSVLVLREQTNPQVDSLCDSFKVALCELSSSCVQVSTRSDSGRVQSAQGPGTDRSARFNEDWCCAAAFSSPACSPWCTPR